MDKPPYEGLELKICRRNRVGNEENPGCYENLDYDEFNQWEWDIYETFPGITLTYSEKQCLGLCPEKPCISVQIDTFPAKVSSLSQIKELINQYLRSNSYEKNNS